VNEEAIPAAEVEILGTGPTGPGTVYRPPPIPGYLQETYWWAYLHPRAVWLFEREWLVNMILWGHMRRLTEAVLEELPDNLPDPVLQVACVYGDFSRCLARRTHQAGSALHLADIAPIQIDNARRKLSTETHVQYHQQDSSMLHFPAGSFACTVLFFLLHEQPAEVRRRTIAEAIRVTRPGGKVVIVDYHRPRKSNPLRYLMRPVLKFLEPFALDLWEEPLESMLGPGVQARQISKSRYGGGLYQKVVLDL